MTSVELWILEDDLARAGRMFGVCDRLLLRRVHFRTSAEMIAALEASIGSAEGLPSLISLDHDLNHAVTADDPSSGMDVVAWLEGYPCFARVIVASTNGTAAPTMVRRLEATRWTVDRVVPADDLDWIDGEWADLVHDACRSFVRGGDIGLRCDWPAGLREAVEDATSIGVLGVLLDDGTILLCEATREPDVARRRFSYHAQLVSGLRLPTGQVRGGFAMAFRAGRLCRLSRRSTVNVASDYLLPMWLVDAILGALAFPLAEEFKISS